MQARPTRRRPRRLLPAFALYGEAGRPGLPLLHVEAIQTRSRLYAWEIGSHLHQELHQVVWVQRGPVRSLLDESRADNHGPLAITVPPGVAHAFRFSAASDGHVLTFDAHALAEGDGTGLAVALSRLFAAPRRLAVPQRAGAAACPPGARGEPAAGAHRGAGVDDRLRARFQRPGVLLPLLQAPHRQRAARLPRAARRGGRARWRPLGPIEQPLAWGG
jgi:AraC family transcriptional activator of pobA